MSRNTHEAGSFRRFFSVAVVWRESRVPEQETVFELLFYEIGLPAPASSMHGDKF